ncbi:MAG: hypothetical protein ACOYMC_10900, partial [Pirellulales bacterium]
NRPSGWSESPQWVERIAPVGGANRPTRHAFRTALRDSLGLIGPAQKHHRAEYLAMLWPA